MSKIPIFSFLIHPMLHATIMIAMMVKQKRRFIDTSIFVVAHEGLVMDVNFELIGTRSQMKGVYDWGDCVSITNPLQDVGRSYLT